MHQIHYHYSLPAPSYPPPKIIHNIILKIPKFPFPQPVIASTAKQSKSTNFEQPDILHRLFHPTPVLPSNTHALIPHPNCHPALDAGSSPHSKVSKFPASKAKANCINLTPCWRTEQGMEPHLTQYPRPSLRAQRSNPNQQI